VTMIALARMSVAIARLTAAHGLRIVLLLWSAGVARSICRSRRWRCRSRV
jgi:hypothetical protein